jgi:DNA-binding response OmpR family regulator
MGGFNGPEVRSQLRLRGVATPIIFITAHHPDDTLDILRLASEVPCLRKPFTGAALIALIERVIGAS